MLLYAVLTWSRITRAQFRMLLLLVVAGGVCAAAYGAHMFYHDPTFAQVTLANRRLIIHVGQYDIDPNHFADALIFPAAIVAMWALRVRSLIAALACIGRLGLIVLAILVSGSREGLIGDALDRRLLFLAHAISAAASHGVGVLAAFAATVQTSVFLRFAIGGRIPAAPDGPRSGPSRSRPPNIARCRATASGTFTQAFNIFYLVDAPAVSVRMGRPGAQPRDALSHRNGHRWSGAHRLVLLRAVPIATA